ncbi:preprotein translocase subunit SecY [Thermogladius calderae 1633]|uniref:Protein translocase subunit SecY n=1 Tax=Thermogladius calderae (strain DSM 22663 / VKM B-2946 / 1633) TaxID=1184251 RepID=I3TDD6_THEC1|nr:preprotein translocase subunit SecY [Thermogladius calderae 1633]
MSNPDSLVYGSNPLVSTMGALDVMARIADYLPAAKKPDRKPSLYERLFWTAMALIVYLVLANTPLYGIPIQPASQQQILLIQVIFASNRGTLMELGIGPIVTAGLIMQILVGAKLVDLDLTDPDDRKKFTSAQKTLAIILAVFEAAMYVLSCRYWVVTGPNPFTACTASWSTRLIVGLQIFAGAYIAILLDEMIQKGWGIGSGVSLFILSGVATIIFWNIFSPVVINGTAVGLIPYIIQAISTGSSLSSIMIRPGGRDLVGLIATIVVAVLVIYLSNMRVNIPITTPRLQSIKTRIPLQFLYVSNIPVLFVGILYADILVFASLFRTYGGGLIPQWLVNTLATYDQNGNLVGGIAYYLNSPLGVYSAYADPVKTVVYIVVLVLLSVVFGYMWVEVSGLNAAAQAQQLVDSGLEVPGMRRNPKVLEKMLDKYITPLTVLSSIIVGVIAALSDVLGVYGGGMGLLLAIGIVQQYYMLIAYERALEAYPLLKRIIGE